jgi:hypothetical protein
MRARCRSTTAHSTSSSRTPSSSTFITTPNRSFPIEVHTRLPFVHWLPEHVAARAYRAARADAGEGIHLLSARAFRSVFPGRVRIVNLGLTLVAIVD